MLTATQPNLKTAIHLKSSHMGFEVFLGEDETQLMGIVEPYPAWGVECLSSLPEDVELSDEVYVALGQVYKRLEQAVAAVTANWLVEGRIELPDYF
jgi:hypothetical protein